MNAVVSSYTKNRVEFTGNARARHGTMPVISSEVEMEEGTDIGSEFELAKVKFLPMNMFAIVCAAFEPKHLA